uniref:Uncharacterized protein n=1 Tax=Magallana gigas TaxID=29159 RepID=K1QTK4_MAGGI
MLLQRDPSCLVLTLVISYQVWEVMCLILGMGWRDCETVDPEGGLYKWKLLGLTQLDLLLCYHSDSIA